MNEPIYVTRPFLPPLDDYVALLRRIWDSRILTNSGPFHQELEARLAEYLGVSSLCLTTNGALALELAIEAAGLSGDVLTTPYSFVATTHAVRRGQLRPVFVDIRPDDFNIDADLIQASITEQTSAIVAVHCYGNPCAVEEIERIANIYGLKVIYDAAHAFGVRLNGRSVFEWGDMSITSFHATKSYNTFEGGALASPHPHYKEVVDRIRNFGITSETSIPVVGTNAKMSELNAALGLLQLDRYEEVRASRRTVDALYREALRDVTGIIVPSVPTGVEPNYSYFPVLVTDDFPLSRDQLYDRLKDQNIFSRRYFYPLLSELPMYRDEPSAASDRLPVATRIARQILCLPLFPGLSPEQIERIVGCIRLA